MKLGLVRKIAIAALLLALAPSAASALTYWVKTGGGPSCTHTTLQAAIDAMNGSTSANKTIYLVGSGPFTGPFSMVGGGGITIVGGVASCGMTTSTQRSTLQAPSGQRPLTILMGEEGRITLRRLLITTNSGTLNSDGGGIWFAAPSVFSTLRLEDTQVLNNGTLKDGGGIFVSKGKVILTGGSLVSSNTAVNGGGIAAINGAAVEVESSNVTTNTAYFDGGGIYAPRASVRIGSTSGLGLPASVANNLAGDDGGGLYIGANGDASLGAVALASINGNQARRGGGLFMDDAWVNLYQAELKLNSASLAGGAIYVAPSGALLTNNADWTADGFPRFSANRAGEGAAIYAEGDNETEIYLLTGTFSNHDTRATGAAMVTANGPLGYFFFRGLTVYGNQGPELFAVEGGAPLELLHSVISGNTVNRLVRWDGTGPGVRVANSIISETEPVFSGLPTPQVLPQLSCIVSPFPLLGTPPGTDLSQVFAFDPRFVAPDRGDFHVWPTSPAIDLCPYAPGGTNAGYDRDRDPRGYDEPFHSNPTGHTYDAGADEVIPVVWDDFESGSFSHWSTVTPGVPGSGDNLQISTAARLGPATSQLGLQLTLVNPSSQTPNPTSLRAIPAPTPGIDSTRLTGSFILDPQGLTMSPTSGFNRLRWLHLLDRDGFTRLSFALVRSSADKWSLEATYVPTNSTSVVVAGNAFFACAALPCGNPADWRNNLIEFEWRGAPGHLIVWRTRYVNGLPDPATRFQMFSVDLATPETSIRQVVLGTFGDQPAGTFGRVFFDELSFTR